MISVLAWWILGLANESLSCLAKSLADVFFHKAGETPSNVSFLCIHFKS